MKNLIICIMCFFCSNSVLSQQKKATYYHDKYQGRKTASGQIFDQEKLTCASNIYKIGTKLKITNPENGKSVIVIVNDTGQLYGRTIDLTTTAFAKIADLKKGVIIVKIEIIHI